MIGWEEKLSAYLDGELPAAEAAEVEARLETDPHLAAAFESLCATQECIATAFDEMLQEPVPLHLAQTVRSAPEAQVATQASGAAGWGDRAMMLAACAAFALVGATGGYFVGQSSVPAPAQVASAGWLSEIAAYHGVYSQQKRHLVEVSADEKDHIETWLSNTVGAQVRVPDLAAQGLQFQGARLLVAAGSPVAQLVFTDAQGAVVALCLKAAKQPQDKGFNATTLQGHDMVSWRSDATDFVVVGPEGWPALQDMARVAALQI